MDEALGLIADYVADATIHSEEAYNTARACLADTLGCGLLALRFPECTKLLGPVVPGTSVPNGSRVPGTELTLDPIRAAFNIGTCIRWLDYNDTWLAAEWGHPSDNLGAILALCDYLSQNGQPLTMGDVLTAMIKAHEIQGGLALLNSFNRIGFDHVILVKVASTAVCAGLLGLSRDQIGAAISQAWIDTGPLRTYRHAPCTGSRKSWAAGDATARGLQLAWITQQGEMGYNQALSSPQWGFQDVLLSGKPLAFQRSLDSYVMENVLFKISYPAEFHAQTAVECALKLHQEIKDRLDEIEEIRLTTHESALRIIDKKGPLNNPADRDHCLQYMVACALIFGELTADHYEDHIAADPRIDALREKMVTEESAQYSEEYLDPEKRSIANSITIHFQGGEKSDRIEVHYPVGHRRRREEGLPLLYNKCLQNLQTCFTQEKAQELVALLQNPDQLDTLPVSTFMEKWVLPQD